MAKDVAAIVACVLICALLIIDGYLLARTAKRLKRLERWHGWDDSGADD